MFKKALVMALILALAGCNDAGQQPRPVKTFRQAPPSPAPSWAVGMDPGCWVIGEPVAYECLEGGAPQCTLRQWTGEAAKTGPCWWVEHDGTVWYLP